MVEPRKATCWTKLAGKGPFGVFGEIPETDRVHPDWFRSPKGTKTGPCCPTGPNENPPHVEPIMKARFCATNEGNELLDCGLGWLAIG